jgi:hypothetical protein
MVRKASRTTATLPLRRWAAMAPAVIARLRSSVQSVSQVSTESVQASQGSAGSGQVCGFHRSAIGSSTAESRWPSRASPVSSGVALGGSRLSVDMACNPHRHAQTCAHLLAGDRHIRRGLVDHRVVNPADHRRAEQPGA